MEIFQTISTFQIWKEVKIKAIETSKNMGHGLKHVWKISNSRKYDKFETKKILQKLKCLNYVQSSIFIVVTQKILY